jgi:nitrite reductase/ring-hydroxylating ferredoxin subunit
MVTENIPKQLDFLAVVEAWVPNAGFVKVAEKKDVPAGKMIHVEVDGNEILIANVGGKFYAVGDRCPHLHARVSEGTLNNAIVTCPRHLSTFDVRTGKVLSGTRSNLQTYDVKVEGNNLLISVE